MVNANFAKHSTQFERFIKVSRLIFNFLGLDITFERRFRSTCIQVAFGLNLVVMTILQIVYNVTDGSDSMDRLNNIIFTNYCIVGIGKLCAISYHRLAMVRALDELEQIYPDERTESIYKLDRHYRYYFRFERFIWIFYRFVGPTFVMMPMLLSLLALLQTGRYPMVLPLLVPGMGETTDYSWWPQYIIYFVLGGLCAICSGMSITGCDLCLYSMITQMCLHFDLLSQKVMELRPDREDKTLRDLSDIARQHVEVKR